MARKVLNYPGSKWRIADKLVDMIPPHHTYLEPYFGSGAVFFRKEPSDIEMVNDLDHDVTNLFWCIQNDAEKLSRLVMTTPYSRQVYDKSFSGKGDEEPYHKACRFLIQCWQGHGFRMTGGKVGWKHDVRGREKMYALWNWYRLPVWVMDIAERLRQVQIENSPALEVIRRFNYGDVFMYIDPPYLLGTRSGKQYRHEMQDEDHEELLMELASSRAQVMISGYESEMYDGMLAKWKRVELESNDNTGRRRKETVWMNYDIGQLELPIEGRDGGKG